MSRLIGALLLLAGCTKAPDFGADAATEGVLTGPGGAVALNGADMAKLEVLFDGLRGHRAEVYSKPDFVLTWSANGKDRTVSFFLDEGLAYPDEYTAAWSERMSGKRSRGAKISSELAGVLQGVAGAD